jgi:hypothetical protein
MKKSLKIVLLVLFCALAPAIYFGVDYYANAVESEDFDFEWILRPDWHNVNPFSQGQAWAQKEEDGPWTLFDTEGNIITDDFSAKEILFYENGFAKFQNKNSMFGFVNLSGDVAVPAEYLSNGSKGYGDGLVNVRTRDGYGFTDIKGELVIRPQFDDAWMFREGRAQAKKDGKWGYIDKNGEWAIPPQFDELTGFFSGGLAALKKDEKYGYIDKDGKPVIDYIFDRADNFINGVAIVSVNKLYGMIDKKGDFLLEPQFETRVFSFEDTSGLFGFVKDGKVGYFDANGKLMIDFKYKYDRKATGFYHFENGLTNVILDEPELRVAIIDTQGEIVFKLPSNTFGVSDNFFGDYIVAWVDGKNCLFDRNGRMYDITRYVAPEFEGKRFYIHATADNVFNVSTENRGNSGYFKITPKEATNDGD